jgi:hypothetical protein
MKSPQSSQRDRVSVTYHAQQRAQERLDQPAHKPMVCYLREAFANSTKLPQRYGAQLSKKWLSGKKQPKGSATYRIAGSTVMVTKGSVIITVWKLSEAELATTIWYALTGQWA